MEALTRIVADSLARHGLDRPIDPRRLQWSRWSHCDSPHSLLAVPSKPGIFALAEEIMDLGPGDISGASKTHVRTAALGVEPSKARQRLCGIGSQTPVRPSEARLDFAASTTAPAPRRMLAVLQFSEDDDMAFTLDRMFTCINPMRARLSFGRCFLRFVVVEDGNQRRSICSALNQWLLNSAEKASGLPAGFSSSLELNVARTPSSASAGTTSNLAQAPPPVLKLDTPAPYLDSGASKNLHCPHPLPSGF